MEEKQLLSQFRKGAKQLQKVFFYLCRWPMRYCNTIKGNNGMATMKEGYFSVITIGCSEPRKFFVALKYLSHPPFLKLLDAAEQEFGFNQEGVLVIPCEPSELQRILS